MYQQLYNSDENLDALCHNNISRSNKLKKGYSKGGSAGIEGTSFQKDLLAVFLLRALRRDNDWFLSTENKEGSKFDDIVFESPGGDVLLQAKHKENDTKSSIAFEDLMSTNSKRCDFSLPKYFVAYQELKLKFKIENVIICTNSRLHKQLENMASAHNLDEKSLLYFESTDKLCHTFDVNIVPILKERIKVYLSTNSQNKDKHAEISDESITDYLRHLQLVANYPSGKKLEAIVEGIVSRITWATNLDSKACSRHVHKRIDEWYREKKGRYLTRTDAKAFFSEVRSDLYCSMLRDHEILFEKKYFPPIGEMKVLHFVPCQSDLLSVIKVWQTVLGEGLTSKTLFLRLDKDVSINECVVDSFEVPLYTRLVIISDSEQGNDRKAHVRELCHKILDILNRYAYKKVLLIADRCSKLAERMMSKNRDACETITDHVRFTHLTKETRQKIREGKSITFQGSDASLDDLRLTDENLNETLCPETLLKLAKGEKINVGRPIPRDRYHILRTLSGLRDTRTEHTVYEDAALDSDNVILISDSAGMGKSYALTEISASIKENHPHLWVVRVDLNLYTKYLSRCRNETAAMLDLLNSQEATELKNSLEENLFSQRGRIVLMVDGVDEISPKYSAAVLNLLRVCRNDSKYKAIFVTTRPHMRDSLEEVLYPKTFTLLPFTISNQIDFLMSYWLREFGTQDVAVERRCETYALKLILQTNLWIRDFHEFVGVPLQTRMLAKVFFDNTRLGTTDNSEDWEGCKEFLESSSDAPKFPAKINLPQLYEMFIDKKRDILIYEKGNGLNDEAVTMIFDRCKTYHRALALEFLFDKDQLENFPWYGKSSGKDVEHKFLLKIGIVNEVDGNLHFVHRTFAEYFVAQVLLTELDGERQNRKFSEFLINELLTSNAYCVVCKFLDKLLTAELDRNPGIVRKNVGFQILRPKGNLDNTFLHVISKEGYDGILRFFLQCYNFERKKSSLSCLYVRKAPKPDVDMRGRFRRTALHGAAELGHLSTVRLLVEAGADPLSKDLLCLTPLQLAAGKGRLQVVRYLSETCGAAGDRGAAVREAAGGGHLAVVEYLMRRGAKATGAAAVHWAASYGHLHVVEHFLARGVAVDAVNSCGSTPLHFAAAEGRLRVVRRLVAGGADVDRRDCFGRTALHRAAGAGRRETVEFLVDGSGAGLNASCAEGRTEADRAAELYASAEECVPTLSPQDASRQAVCDAYRWHCDSIRECRDAWTTYNFLRSRGANGSLAILPKLRLFCCWALLDDFE